MRIGYSVISLEEMLNGFPGNADAIISYPDISISTAPEFIFQDQLICIGRCK